MIHSPLSAPMQVRKPFLLLLAGPLLVGAGYAAPLHERAFSEDAGRRDACRIRAAYGHSLSAGRGRGTYRGEPRFPSVTQ